jgi:hypothetical protein
MYLQAGAAAQQLQTPAGRWGRMTGVGQEQKASRPNLMGGGDTAEVGHVLDGPDGEAAVDEAVVHEHVGHSEQRDAQPLRATQRNAEARQTG